MAACKESCLCFAPACWRTKRAAERSPFQSGKSESHRTAGASSRVQRVYRMEKTPGAMEYTSCALASTRPQNGENSRRGETRFACGMKKPRNGNKRPLASSACTEWRKPPARWNTLCVLSRPPSHRTEKVTGAVKHATRARRNTLRVLSRPARI